MGGPTESVSDFTLGCTWSKSSSICHNYTIICGYMVWLYSNFYGGHGEISTQ